MQAGTISPEQAFQRGLELDPLDAMALIFFSHIRYQAGDLAAAEEYCWRAASADPARFEPFYTLYRCLSGCGEDEALRKGILALALRKMLRSEAGDKHIAEIAKDDPDPEGVPATRQRLEDTAEALEAQSGDEPEDIARQLKPHRLIDELLEMAPDGLDLELVDKIVEEGARCVPLLVGVLRTMVAGELPDGDTAPGAAAVALLGEIGDPAAVPEVIECCSVADEPVREAAYWAAQRFAARWPQETFEALSKMAEGADAGRRCIIAFLLADMPRLPGGSDLLMSLLDGFEDFSKAGVARIAASSTACRARLNPTNSRRMPRWTTRASIRDRGGVASRARTSSSRQEQAASRTTPRTAVAGAVGNTGFQIALSAIRSTSSVRFTTAAPVAWMFRNVVVSRKGLSTITSSPHSTPMGAKLGRPSGSSVVTIDSTMKGIRSSLRQHGKSHVRGVRRRAVDPLGRGAKIRWTRLEDVADERLGIPVVEGEPGALHLDHDPVPLPESVTLLMEIRSEERV